MHGAGMKMIPISDEQNYDTMEKLEGLAYRLERFNAWRRGAEIDQPHPKQTGLDIEAAIDVIRSKADAHAMVERGMNRND